MTETQDGHPRSGDHLEPAGDFLSAADVSTVGLVGLGSVGTAWAALLLARGLSVVATDPSPMARQGLEDRITEIWPTLVQLGLTEAEVPPTKSLEIVTDVRAVALASDLVQENGPEGREAKLAIIAEIDSFLPPNRLILSSSGGTPPSVLQAACQHPQRCLIGHPFHPAYIVPLVEVVAGDAPDEAVEATREFYLSLGKYPVVVRRERVGHLANRLQFSLLREAVACLRDGVASATDIDATIRYGLGPRWALMGPLMTFNLAGGKGGIADLLSRFAPDVQSWWDDLASPRLDEETQAALVEGVEELRGQWTNAEWERWRDNAMVSYAAFAQQLPSAGTQAQRQDGSDESVTKFSKITRKA